MQGEHISITIGGIIIQEPSTVITNFMIAVAAIFYYYKIKRYARGNRIIRFASLFFLFLFWSTILGGVIGHGLQYYTGLIGKIPGWYLGMASIAMLERAAIIQARYFLPLKFQRFLSIFNFVEIFIFMLLSIIKLDFIFVELHAFYGLFIVVFILECIYYSRSGDRESLYVFGATFWGVCAVLCHALKLSPHPWFNYNDLSHIFMILGIVFYYYGFKDKTRVKIEQLRERLSKPAVN